MSGAEPTALGAVLASFVRVMEKERKRAKLERRLKRRPITLALLGNVPGLTEHGRAELVLSQPLTVVDALRIRGVGRKTTKLLMKLGLLIDPEGAQGGR